MDWLQMIQQVAFPIVACTAMAWFVVDQTEKHRKERAESDVRHAEEVSKLTEVIQNNTLAITKLTDKLEK